MTRTSAAVFLGDEFSQVPDLIRLYESYPYNVLRADLLRYLILWYHGGYYADMDILPARPVKSCPSLSPLFATPPTKVPSLVLGIEIDEPYASPQLMHDWHWSRSYGFIQYNMYAPRRFSPLLRRAIVRVLSHTRQHQQHSNYFSRPKYDESTTLEITGPGVFTDAVLDVLSETLPGTHPLITRSIEKDEKADELRKLGGTSKRVTWAPFHRLQSPLWVDASEATGGDMGGLGVMPINVWGNGQRHSEAGFFNHPLACINHRFGRTWKKGWWEYLFG